MSTPFFRPREVHTQALILIGYRLYPCARIELHPRLTLLAGGNGAGKTTVLDALQTILVADQRYLHLNVAAGQNDRDLSGQLQDRTAWAVLHLQGHEKVTAIGVHIARRAVAEYVDLKPFALIGIAPDQGLFLCPEQSRVTRDLKELSQVVSPRSAGARVKEFASINDYHRFLYDEGLLPLDLSRGGKRQFSLLWRQATQPHLGELNHFLQKTLCHEPEKRLTFDDVERLMQERLHTERQLNRLGELKGLNARLREKANHLDHHRRLTLAIGLGQAEQREASLRRDLLQGKERFQLLDIEIGTLKGELDRDRERLLNLGKERDKYLQEQGEWSRKYKHYQEYVAHGRLAESLREELSWAQEDICPSEDRIREIRERMETLRPEMQAVSNDLARRREKERELESRLRKWKDFQKELERTSKAVGEEIRTLSDLEGHWVRINAERRGVQELKPSRQLLVQWESRARAYRSARESCQAMIDLWPDFFGRNDLDSSVVDLAQTELRREEKDIALRRDKLSREMKAQKDLVDELSKSRLPLPSSAADLVERGLASPFVNRFDTLDLEAARECQDKVGPLARAIVPDSDLLGASMKRLTGEADALTADRTPELPPVDNPDPIDNGGLSQLALGKEPFWLVLSPDAWKDFGILARSREGVIAHCGEIAWYSPNGPVWIGAQARRDQIQRAQERVIEIETELKDLDAREELISRRLRSIQSFLPKLDGLSDAIAEQAAEELREKIRELERNVPRIEKLFPMLQKLFQKSELFNFVTIPGELERLQAEIEETSKQYSQQDEMLTALKKEESRCASELDTLRSGVQSLERDLERVKTICARLEAEEPREVLLGTVDFGRAEELAARIEELDRKKEEVQNALLLGERKNGELRNRYKVQSETLVKLKSEFVGIQDEHEKVFQQWKEFYPHEKPHYVTDFRPADREQHKASWDGLAQELKSLLAEVSAKYELRLAPNDQPDRMVDQLLQLLLPPGVQLDQLENQYSRLQHELAQVEHKIKSHVEEVRSNVEMEIRRMKMHVVKVNRILSTLSFGQIKKIYLELEELPAYQTLKKLESVLRMVSRSASITLKEFVQKLRDFILKESNTTLSEEQIADYRSYIRIRRVVIDRDDRVRDSGLSSGETLGVNLALCLAVLFFLGRQQGSDGEGGMLLLALDEAERLDAKALETIRDLLDEVRCQLTVAMPRPVDISDSICHLLTPLSQGVTHIHLYHRGGNGEGRQAV